MKRHVVLSVLFFRDQSAGAWVAQALERDIAAYGPSFEEAKVAFERTVAGYFQLDIKRHREPLATLKAAPQLFWEAWERVRSQVMQAEQVPTTDAYMIPAKTEERLQTVQ